MEPRCPTGDLKDLASSPEGLLLTSPRRKSEKIFVALILTRGRTGVPPRVCLPGPKIYRAGGGDGGGTAASGWRMVNAGGPGPVMAVAGQRRRAYHPKPLTLGGKPAPSALISLAQNICCSTPHSCPSPQNLRHQPKQLLLNPHSQKPY
jgi:hypothetical protein